MTLDFVLCIWYLLVGVTVATIRSMVGNDLYVCDTEDKIKAACIIVFWPIYLLCIVAYYSFILLGGSSIAFSYFLKKAYEKCMSR